MKILITGVAGFIGAALARRLLDLDHQCYGIDTLNDYYDVELKNARLSQLTKYSEFSFGKVNISDRRAMGSLFETNQFDAVVNLAAQPGVRYSLINPAAYIDTNIVGFGNILEGCRHQKVEHLVFASSSSVYGANTKVPYSEHDNVDHPISLYAASKKANELMAHSYSHLYGLPCTGLRFFTVYGPWGRPDMAPMIFTKKIKAGESIPVFNHGNLMRDFTYIDDIVEGVAQVLVNPPVPNDKWDNIASDPATSHAPYRVYNIGNNKPVQLLDFIKLLGKHLGREVKMEMLPMQNGDVCQTWANIDDLFEKIGFQPKTSIDKGISHFVQWYNTYYSQ